MTNQSTPFKGAFHYLADLAEAKLSTADYAMEVRQLYDVLVEETNDPSSVRNFVLFQMNLQVGRSAISNRHYELVVALLPQSPARARGRPKGALGTATYEKKYKLYADWIYEHALNPSLTKERFAMARLGITDEMLSGSRGERQHKRLEALLQELKPARMRYLDENQLRALEVNFRLVLTEGRKEYARRWREAKKRSAELTKEQFIRIDIGLNGEVSKGLLQRQLDYLEAGELLLAASEDQ